VTARIAAAANIRASADCSARARKSAAAKAIEAATTAIQPNPPNPARRPPIYARYAAVMSGSWTPIERCPMLDRYRVPHEIIWRVAQSKRADYTASGSSAR
jgi:hypothetical protein